MRYFIRLDLTRIVSQASVALVVITYIILFILILIIALAMPTFRKVKHDQFEMVHRVRHLYASLHMMAKEVLTIAVPWMDCHCSRMGSSDSPHQRLQ